MFTYAQLYRLLELIWDKWEKEFKQSDLEILREIRSQLDTLEYYRKKGEIK